MKSKHTYKNISQYDKFWARNNGKAYCRLLPALKKIKNTEIIRIKP